MQFELKGTGFHISDNNREFVQTMLHRIDKFSKHIESLVVTIHKETELLYRIKADIHFHWKAYEHITHDDKDLYPGIEYLFEELAEKCRREHGKHVDHHRGKCDKRENSFNQ